jgi:hypothetical protein
MLVSRKTFFLAVAPPLRSTDKAKGHHTEPEVNYEAKIHLEQPVSGRYRQGGHKDVIGCIAQQHRQERLEEVGAHREFRHREQPPRVAG